MNVCQKEGAIKYSSKVALTLGGLRIEALTYDHIAVDTKCDL